MDQETIVFISFALSALVIIVFNLIKNFSNRYFFRERANRINYIRKLVSDKVISIKIVDVNLEKDRLKQPDNNNGIIVDDILYSDENAYFLEIKNTLYIIGKNEDICIALKRNLE